MIVLVGESGKWEARCKRIKDTAQHTSCSYGPLKQWRYQHTLQMLQTLNTHAAHFDTIVSKIIQSAAFSFLLMNIITSKRKKRVHKFSIGARMTWSRVHTANPQELGATGKKYDLSPFTTYRWSTICC